MSVELGGDGLRLVAAGGGEEFWPYDDVALKPQEVRGRVSLGRGEAWLAIEDQAAAAALAAAAPHLRRRARRGLLYGSTGTVALLALVGGLWWGMPAVAAWLAPHVPVAWEQQLSRQVELEPWWGPRCVGRDGAAALAKLTRRLTAGTDAPYSISVSVRDNARVNAFALPGGRIVLLSGLIKEAQSPDEVAGVLAHEFTHALKRHPMRALIANSGLVLLAELTLGNGTGASAGVLLTTLSYSRAMEAEADAGAVELLRRAGIDTEGLAAFFERLEKQEAAAGKAKALSLAIPDFLRSHPATQQRLAAIQAAATKGEKPALSASEWQALKGICATVEK